MKSPSAEDDESWQRLEREAVLLGRLTERCELTVPRILAVDAGARLQVRRSALEHFLFVPDTSERWREIVAWSREAFAHRS